MRTSQIGLTILAIALPLLKLHAQEPMQILSAKDEPLKMLYKFLQAEAQRRFDARRKLVASLDTPEKIAKRQAELKARFIESIGAFPGKTPLKPASSVRPRAMDSSSRGHLRKPAQPSRDCELLPTRRQGTVSGVLVPCGHSVNGRPRKLTNGPAS